MSDEQTWERRWIKAVATLADRDDEIERLKAQYERLEQMWNSRPTGTRAQRESQLEKRLEESEALAFQLAEQVNQARSELAAISSAIGSVRYMDPPDGGSPTLAEQVTRMREAHEAAEKWRQQFDYCMCGSPMDSHDIESGHSPVSMYEYHMDQPAGGVDLHGHVAMTDEEKWERRFLNAMVIIADRDEKIDILRKERDNLETNLRLAAEARATALAAEVERLRSSPDLLNRLDNMGKELLAERTLRTAAEASLSEATDEVERLRDQLLRRNEQNERLIEILNDQRASAKALVVEQGNHRIMRERAEKEVERLTRERDDERSNHRRTVEAMEFEQRDTEAALGREGEGEKGFDFRAHLQRQRDWSGKTFGPGPRTKGVIDHIRKELGEIEADPSDIAEWIDVVILALDGAWRAGHSPDQIIAALTAKQSKNERRNWPDWRTMPEDQAIEHVRTGKTLMGAKQ